MLVETLQNSQENTCARVSFLIKLQALLIELNCKLVISSDVTSHDTETVMGENLLEYLNNPSKNSIIVIFLLLPSNCGYFLQNCLTLLLEFKCSPSRKFLNNFLKTWFLIFLNSFSLDFSFIHYISSLPINECLLKCGGL